MFINIFDSILTFLKYPLLAVFMISLLPLKFNGSRKNVKFAVVNPEGGLPMDSK